LRATRDEVRGMRHKGFPRSSYLVPHSYARRRKSEIR
jgi:hypothetical protein